MNKYVLAVTISAFILLCGPMLTSAQQSPGSSMMHQPDQQQSHRGMMGEGGMMGHGMMGRGMIMRMIFALMDADGDGTISLQEFQAAHERIFRAMDANKDGRLTLEEMQAFMHGSRQPVPQR
jgi:hypothetical protein